MVSYRILQTNELLFALRRMLSVYYGICRAKQTSMLQPLTLQLLDPVSYAMSHEGGHVESYLRASEKEPLNIVEFS